MSSISKICSFARLKPLDEAINKQGGTKSVKQITGFDEQKGVVELGGMKFDHFHAVVKPDAAQTDVYQTVAQGLVQKWLDGFDADLIAYGQTGAGKTFTMFGPPLSMEKALAALKGGGAGAAGISGEGILQPEHGVILRAGFEALAAVSSLQEKGCSAALHGSMVEMSIMSLQDQSVVDLLNKRRTCYVDKAHHLQGALMVPIRTAQDLVSLSAAVETRLTRGTKMNDTSSRSHCVTVFTLSVMEGEQVRQSRLQFFDLMGSERFKGANAAHDEGKSTKSSVSGWEGIYANLSLSSLMSAVDLAAKNRRKGKGGSKKQANAMLNFCLTELLQGSLNGSAVTGMVTCMSQHPRNGDETYLSLKYGAGMSELLNKPARQPSKVLAEMLASARKGFKESSAIVARGVQGKYQALRSAEVTQWEQEVILLSNLEKKL